MEFYFQKDTNTQKTKTYMLKHRQALQTRILPDFLN